MLAMIAQYEIFFFNFFNDFVHRFQDLNSDRFACQQPHVQTTIKTSASARRMSGKREGATPRPLFNGNISSRIVCLCLAYSKLSKLMAASNTRGV